MATCIRSFETRTASLDQAVARLLACDDRQSADQRDGPCKWSSNSKK